MGSELMESITLVNYKILKLNIPLKRPFITSIRSSNSLKGIFYEVLLSDGSVGYGESSENIKLTGESRLQMKRFSKEFLDGHLNVPVEKSISDLKNYPKNIAARYGLETALIDAMARHRSEEINELLNLNLSKRKMENDTTISILGEQETISETKRVLKKGYRHIKYKINGDKSEIDRILMLQDYIPNRVSIRIDPNQSWDCKNAMDFSKELEKSNLNIEFIEQPVKVSQVQLMKRLSISCGIPIIADESVFNLEDAKSVIDKGYGNAINIKLIKCGGPLEAIEIANYADKKGISCLFGCTTEANIAMTMASYLSAGLKNVNYIDLDGLDYISDSPFAGGINDSHGVITIPSQNNGLGITLREDKSNEYITDWL